VTRSLLALPTHITQSPTTNTNVPVVIFQEQSKRFRNTSWHSMIRRPSPTQTFRNAHPVRRSVSNRSPTSSRGASQSIKRGGGTTCPHNRNQNSSESTNFMRMTTLTTIALILKHPATIKSYHEMFFSENVKVRWHRLAGRN
jgi:hypothetical protein